LGRKGDVGDLRHKGKVDASSLPESVLAELRERGMSQRGLLRYFMRGNSIVVKRI